MRERLVRTVTYGGLAVLAATGGYFLRDRGPGINNPVQAAVTGDGESPKVDPGRFETKTPDGVSLDDPRGVIDTAALRGGSLAQAEPERFAAQAPQGGGPAEAAERATRPAPLEEAKQPVIISGRPIQKGETFKAPAGSIVGGEAFIEGERLFDDIATTAQISVFSEEVTVYSPFGGSMISGGTEEEMTPILGRVMVETLRSGCGNGCNEIDLVLWPGGRRSRGVAPAELDREMKPGETLMVGAGSIVKGDVVVSGRRLFDNDANTGAIAEVHKDSQVFAEWGANVTFVGFDKPTVDRLVGAAVEEMKLHGCVNDRGCDSVTVYKVGPQPDLTIQPGSLMPSAPKPTPVPEQPKPGK